MWRYILRKCRNSVLAKAYGALSLRVEKRKTY